MKRSYKVRWQVIKQKHEHRSAKTIYNPRFSRIFIRKLEWYHLYSQWPNSRTRRLGTGSGNSSIHNDVKKGFRMWGLTKEIWRRYNSDSFYMLQSLLPSYFDTFLTFAIFSSSSSHLPFLLSCKCCYLFV